MKLATATTAIAGALLFAGAALAYPSPEGIEKMTARRHERLRRRLERSRSRPNMRISPEGASAIAAGSSKSVQYSGNWAGAIQIDTNVTEVTATFVVPNVTAGTGSASMYGAAFWVGIDGDTCQSAILQTGVSGVVENGQTEYAAWYEWYPNYSYTFAKETVHPGDQIVATVIATSTVSGTASIANRNTNLKSTAHFTNQGKYGALCGTNAEWIAEDFEEGGSQIPFANFHSVAFTSASYVADGGRMKTLAGATIMDMSQNGQVVASATTPSASEVLVTYTG